MKEGSIYAGGVELNFFSSSTFEPENPDNPEKNAVIIARNALRVLMMGWQDIRGLLSQRVLRAVFIKRDPALLRGMRSAFQQGFDHVYSQLQYAELTELQFNQAQLFLSNCLTILPFADITPFESFKIPQFVQGHWQQIEYKVTPIELTPVTGFKALFLNDADRVFAYGLEPMESVLAESHLIFMGTTYPAGQGFITQLNTDFEPFETAGQTLYQSGHKRIEAWLDRQAYKKTHVCGISLGGSLALLLALDQGDKLSRVDALNPVGIYDSWKKSPFDLWDSLNAKPDVFIQKQGNDPVSWIGVWKKDWHVLQVSPRQDKQGLGAGADHALNYAGMPGTQFKVIDTEKDNQSRRIRNFLLYGVLRSVLYYLILVPLQYVLLPLIRYLSSHEIIAAASGVCIALAFLFPSAIIPMVMIASVLNLLTFAHGVFHFNQDTKGAHCHAPELPRNDAQDIYRNDTTTTFTLKEIGEYYRVKRCLLKNKPFIPSDNSKSHVRFFDGRTKKDVLEQSLDPAHHQDPVTITASKAKIWDIKETLRIFHRQSETLKEELATREDEYVSGKCYFKNNH